MAESEQPITTNDLQRQITALGARMDEGFRELKEIVRSSESRLRDLENREAACNPIVNAKLDAAWREIDDHETKIRDLNGQYDEHEVAIAKLMQQIKVMTWIAGIAGAALITWLVAQVLNLIAK